MGSATPAATRSRSTPIAIAFPPFSQDDLEAFRNSRAAAAPPTGAAPAGTAPPRRDLQVSQFGDPLLSSAEALAACGPAAAVAFARNEGRNPTLREAVDAAKQYGWTPETGMAGVPSEQKLLASMGVATKVEAVNWDKVASDVAGGNPVILSSPGSAGHYWVASDFDANTGKFYVGASGKAYAKGAEWLSPDQMAGLSGAPTHALYIDHPNGPDPSVATTDPLRAYAAQAAQRAGIDPGLYIRQIDQESGFNPNAKSPAGATGIAQIVPQYHPGVDPTDPYQSLDYGANLMRSNLNRYGGDYRLALAAYNAGPGAVDQYGGVPPYPETQRYVSTILGGNGNPSSTSYAPSSSRSGSTASAGAPGGILPDLDSAPPALRPLIARAQAFVEANGGQLPDFSAPAPTTRPTPFASSSRTVAPSSIDTTAPPAAAPDPLAAINAHLKATWRAQQAPATPAPTPMVEGEATPTAVIPGGTVTPGSGQLFPSPAPPPEPAPPSTLIGPPDQVIKPPDPYSGPGAGTFLEGPAQIAGAGASAVGTTVHDIFTPGTLGNPITGPMINPVTNEDIPEGMRSEIRARAGVPAMPLIVAGGPEAAGLGATSFVLSHLAPAVAEMAGATPEQAETVGQVAGIAPYAPGAVRAAAGAVRAAPSLLERVGGIISGLRARPQSAETLATAARDLEAAANEARGISDDALEISLRRQAADVRAAAEQAPPAAADASAAIPREIVPPEPRRYAEVPGAGADEGAARTFPQQPGDVLHDAAGQRFELVSAPDARGIVEAQGPRGERATLNVQDLRAPTPVEMTQAEFTAFAGRNPAGAATALDNLSPGTLVGGWQRTGLDGAEAWHRGKAYTDSESLFSKAAQTAPSEAWNALQEDVRAGQGLGPLATRNLAGAAIGASGAQSDTDENTTPQERALRAAGGAAVGFAAPLVVGKRPAVAEAIAQGASTALRDLAGNVRLSKYPEEVRAMIAKGAELDPTRMESARRGVLPDGVVEDLAKYGGTNVDQIVKRWKPGQAQNAETVLAMREALAAQSKRVESAQAAFRAAPTTEHDPALGALMEEITKHRALQEAVSGVTAEAGRALRQFRQGVTGEDETSARLSQLLRVLGKNGQNGADLHELGQILAHADLSDPVAVANQVRALYAYKKSDYFNSLLYNALLSGPRGRIVDVLSSAMAQAAYPLETAAAVPFDIARSLVTRAPRQVLAGEVRAEYVGMRAALADGWREAVDVLKHGYTADQARADVAAGTREPFRGKLAFVNAPSRMVAANDAFFGNLALKASLYSQAVQQAYGEGLRGRPAATRAAELLQDLSPEMVKAARESALYRTWRAPNGLANVLGHFRDWTPAGVPVGRFVVPFVQTPINLTRYALERSPLGVVPAINAGARGMGAREVELALGRATMGTMLFAGAAQLAQRGDITGPPPESPAERDAFYRAGKQPYAMRVGGAWQSYQWIPTAPVLASAAAAAQAHAKGATPDATAVATAMGLAIAKSFIDAPYVQSLSNTLSAIESPDRSGAHMLNSLATMPIPQAIQAAARASDTVVRDPQSPLEAIQAVIPGLSERVRPRLDAFGRESARPAGQTGVTGLVNPLRSSEAKTDPVEAELARLQDVARRTGEKQGAQPAPPPKSLSVTVAGESVPTNSEQRQRYEQAAGALAYGLLSGFVADPGWAKLPDAEKLKLVRAVFAKSREYAKELLTPELVTPALEQKQRQSAQRSTTQGGV